MGDGHGGQAMCTGGRLEGGVRADEGTGQT